MSSYQHALSKVMDAAATGSIGAHSTGEALMAALALNRFDWLAAMGYTIVEALERIDDHWRSFLPQIARDVAAEQTRGAEAERLANEVMALAPLAASRDADPIRCDATLVTTGSAPGYRDATLQFDLQPSTTSRPLRIDLRLRPEDGEPIVRHILEVHDLAWRNHEPLDLREGEGRPRWIDARR